MNAKISPHQLKTKPIGAADHYNFRISIYEGERRKVIECTQYDIQDELKPVANYIEKSSKRDKWNDTRFKSIQVSKYCPFHFYVIF